MSIQNPRTYLDLCQRAAIECGVSSTVAIQTALPTVVDASGSLGRIVNWVSDAWSDLQCDHDDWDFMRSSNILGAGVSFATVAGQPSYPLGTGAGTVGVDVADFGKWDYTTFRNFTTAVGYINENFLTPISFDRWRDGYAYGAQRNVQTRPTVIAIGPDQSLNLGPYPNGLYTITGDYWVAPSTMVLDTDVPVGLPARFYMLIVYYALMKYGQYTPAPEAYQRGQMESNGMYRQLQVVRAPRIGWAGALA